MLRRFTSRAIAILAAASVFAAVPMSAATAAECELPSFEKHHRFVAEAWAVPDPQFDVGEPLRLQMRVSTPAYMTIFHVSTSCKVTRLLHNLSMKPTEIVNFPLEKSGLRITVKPPAGTEGFYFVATRDKLDFLSGADILGEAAGIASLDLNPHQYYRRLSDALGRVNPADSSVTTLYTVVASH